MSAPVRILLVEDNVADADLARELLEETGVECVLETVRDGEEATELIQDRREMPDLLPNLILLDLNLPRKDGREVLQELKSDALLRRIPVVVLTTSSSQLDVAQAYELQANAYVTKPMDLDAFSRTIEALAAFWLEFARLPAA